MVRVKIAGRQFSLSWEEFEKALLKLDLSSVEILPEIPVRAW